MLLPGEKKQLDLRFKGKRTYLHGTDIYLALLELVPVEFPLDFSIHKMTTCQLEAYSLPYPGLNIKDFAGLLHTGNNKKIGLLETKIPVKKRYSYDEESIIACSEYRPGKITLTAQTKYSFVENIVAMNKAMLTKEIPEQDIKWLFTQLRLEAYPEDDALLTLKLAGRIGTRLVSSRILSGESVIGKINFTGIHQ